MSWWQWIIYLILVAHWVALMVVDFIHRMGQVGLSSWPIELQWVSFWVITVGGAIVSGFFFLGLGLHAVLNMSDKTRTYHP